MIKCVSRYTSSLGAFKPGDVIDSPVLAAALLADSPGSFELVQEQKQLDDAQPIAVVQKPQRLMRRKG